MDTSKMTLREKVLQTIVTCTYYIKQEKSIEEFFRKYPVGGLYFAKSHVQDLAGIMESGTITDTSLIDECRKASKTPLIVCADGANIGKNGVHLSSVQALAATRDWDLAYRVGRAIGMQMNYNHIDWVLGPCIDMALSPVAEVLSQVATDDPEINSAMYSAVVRGIQDEGVAATVKHFPGLGTHHVNFHFGPGQNVLSMDEWMKTYGRSYLACFAENALSVMTSHLTFRAFSDKGDDGKFPIATYSSDLTVKLLKEKLGFKGAVVTDALIMGGMATGSQIEDSVQAFKSGADFLLWPPMETADRIVEEIEKGNIPMSRLDDALSRIEYVRKHIGLDDAPERTYRPVDSDFVDQTFHTVTERGMTCLSNKDGVLPLSPATHKKVLVVGCAKNEKDMDKLRPIADELKKRGFDATFQEYLLICWQDQMEREVNGKYDLVLVCHHSLTRQIVGL